MRLSAAWAAGAFAGLCLGAAGLSSWSKAHQPVAPVTDAQALTTIPAQFGGWSAVNSDEAMVSASLQDEHGRPIALYDRIVARTYVRPGHAPVMLMVAYKRRQYQEDRVHRPELCYVAQGFVLTHRASQKLRLGGRELSAASFTGEAPGRRETVLYFIRSAAAITESPVAQRLALFKAWLSSANSDGVLVRVSSAESPAINGGDRAQQASLQSFLNDLISASPAQARGVLIGSDPLHG